MSDVLELTETVFDEMLAELEQLPDGQREEALSAFEIGLLATIACQHDNVDGYRAFYQVITELHLPEHALAWIESIYSARDAGMGIVAEAFRGSTKTTTLTQLFTAFRIGHEPHRANLLIQVGDDIATDNAQTIADIIEHNPGWKAVFPHVVPDIDKGWGASGYEVKDTRMSYPAWRQKCASSKDPTLVGLGYKSRAIIGKHPDGVLLVDDIHDENNTISQRELDGVMKRLTGTIFPTMTDTTWAVFVGTPWREGDVLDYVKATGQFQHVFTPAFRIDPDGDAELDGERVRLTWPGRFSVAELVKQMALAGKVEFARMFRLDLAAAKVDGLKHFGYPNDRIDTSWPQIHGVDYASIIHERQKDERNRSYFALGYVAKRPEGGAVVVDGVRERCTQKQAEAHVQKGQGLYPNVDITVVESDGKAKSSCSF